jgi:DNA primase
VISRETIDEVKSRIDILDVISDFVSVKRSGQNYKALSPFTNEKTASFYVVPSKGIFKDFSSGKGGDAITFVMEHEGMGYLEAIRYMAKKYGVEIKEEAVTAEQTAQQNDRDSLYILMNYAKDYFAGQLYNSDEGKSIGLSYFRERGYNDRTIERFELGYSINEWDSFNKMALSAGHSEDMLEKAGLIIKKEGGRFYDRFRGRVIFPIHNPLAHVFFQNKKISPNILIRRKRKSIIRAMCCMVCFRQKTASGEKTFVISWKVTPM